MLEVRVVKVAGLKIEGMYPLVVATVGNGMPVDDVCGCESSRGKVYSGQLKDIASYLVDQVVVVQLGRVNSRIG